MTSDRVVKLVNGYLRNLDYPCADARSLDLHHRVAIAIQAYPRDYIEYFLDTDLLLGTLGAICLSVEHDAVSIQLREDEGPQLASLQELTQWYGGQPPACREPFYQVRFTLAARLVAMVRMSSMLREGIPDPYHRTYTLTLHTRDALNERIVDACQKACVRAGGKPVVLVGHSRPSISMWKKLHDFVCYDAQKDAPM